jgi:pimeloyl-ACP methyl ester carboxylesterase
VSKVDADKRHTHSDLVDVFSRRRVLLLLPLGILLAQIKTALSADAVAVGSHQESERAVADRSFFGLYRKTQSHYLGIARFTADAGESGLLMSGYTSGVVRRLSQVANAEFTMGSSFTGASPVELILRFRKDENGNTVGVSLQPPSAHETFAERVPLVEEQISFQDGPAKLAGTLLLPQGKRPNAAIILLHGSGALTRDSFGPYPYFFASLGLAVLIYDKRGTGASTGARLDGTIGPPLQPSAAFYPDDLVSDALAALKFMRTRKEINPEAIGLWGSSEGGMLATQVAAQSTHVAFVINSSGSVAPVWQTLLYQVQAVMKARGNSASEIERALDYTRLWIGVARTGKQFEVYLKRRQEILDDKEPGLFWSSLKFTTADEMRWDWDHILSFDPLPAIRKVRCPVLGVFGELDESTDAVGAANSMGQALAEGGNHNFTAKIFQNAGHSLLEVSSGSRMAPDLFKTIGSWLTQIKIVE